jgi:RimJ/RimL family protein N-acetyltransferase
MASEAARALIQHAFGTMGLKRLVIKTDPANAKIRGAALRHGFTFEGVHAVEPGPGGPLNAVAVYVRLAE